MTWNGTYHVDCLVEEQQQQQRDIIYVGLTLRFFSKCTDSILSRSASTTASVALNNGDGNTTLPVRHQLTALVAGPTGCGKTHFVFKLIENVRTMIDSPPHRVIYCYGEYQQLFRKYPRVTFQQGLPNMDDFDGS